MNLRPMASSLLLASLLPCVAGEVPPASGWELIAPCFHPPPEYADQLSGRSPLLFADGARVKTAADWPRRRAEILGQWQELMGSWPPVITRPKLEYLSKRRRDRFTQHRVKLEIAPQQTGEGWLLVPDGRGSFPAVLVVYYEPETSIGLGKEPLRDFGFQLARKRPCKNKCGVYWQNYDIMRQGAHGAFRAG